MPKDESQILMGLSFKLKIAPRLKKLDPPTEYTWVGEYKKGYVGIETQDLENLMNKLVDIIGEAGKKDGSVKNDYFSVNANLPKGNLSSAILQFKNENELLKIELSARSFPSCYNVSITKDKEETNDDNPEKRFSKLFHKDYEVIETVRVCRFNLEVEVKSSDYSKMLTWTKELKGYLYEHFRANDFPRQEKEADFKKSD